MSYLLTKTQVELTLDMLEREQRSHPVTRFEAVSYHLLQFFIAGYVVSSTFFVILGWIKGFPDQPGAIEMTFLVLYLVFSVLAICWFIVNLVYAKRFRKRLRLLSQFGVLRVLDDPWKAEKKRRGLGRFFSALLLIFGFIGTALSILALAAWVAIGSAIGATAKDLVAVALAISLGLMTSLMLIGYYFLRRARLRHRLVAEVGRLREILESEMEESDEGFVLEAKTHRRLAAIERAQIQRTRAEAIHQSMTKIGLPDYAILKSDKLIEQQAGLEPGSMLAVEYAIQGLASDPRPETVETSEGESALVLPIENTSSELVYEVDDQARRILVHGLLEPDRPDQPQPPQPPQPEEELA